MSHIADGVGRGLIALVSVASLFLQRRRAALRAAAGSGALAPEAGAPVTEREDARYVRICEELLHGSGLPEQSRFRVAAVISYVSTSGRHEHAVGINVESTVISADARLALNVWRSPLATHTHTHTHTHERAPPPQPLVDELLMRLMLVLLSLLLLLLMLLIMMMILLLRPYYCFRARVGVAD